MTNAQIKQQLGELGALYKYVLAVGNARRLDGITLYRRNRNAIVADAAQVTFCDACDRLADALLSVDLTQGDASAKLADLQRLYNAVHQTSSALYPPDRDDRPRRRNKFLGLF